MSFSSGVFSINSAGQPVVTGTVISSTAFNALTSDLASGLSTCVLKDGTQTITANLPMGGYKFTGLGAGSTSGDSVRYEQVSGASALPWTLIDSKGDLIAGTAADTAAKLTAGANGSALLANSAATTGLSYASFLRSLGPFGATLSNNAGDATNDIDIAAGGVGDSTGAVWMVLAAMTKRLDAGWAAGTNQGFRNSAIAITDTTYHVYSVSKADGTQDYYAHTSTTVATVITALQAEVGGTDYLYARRIGSILRESSAIVAFSQVGDQFLRSISILDINATAPGTSAVLRTLSVPVGLKLQAMVNVFTQTGSGESSVVYLSSPDQSDETPSTTSAPLFSIGNTASSTNDIGVFQIRTNTSAQIRSKNLQSDTDTILRMATLGWIDTRGRGE